MIFIYLFLSHLLADFLLQPNSLIKWKNRSWLGVLVHAFVHLLVMLLFLWLSCFSCFSPFVLGVLVMVALSHWIIDITKIRLEKRNHKYVVLFFVDQVAHISILTLAGFLLSDEPLRSFKGGVLFFLFNPYVLLFLIFAILISYGYEIVKLQFALEKNAKTQFDPHFKEFLHRWIAFSVIYFVIVVLVENFV